MPLPPEQTHSIPFLISDIARLLRRDFNRRVQPLGLTQEQWRTLAFLRRNEGLSQAALADILEIQPISLVRIIDKLAAKGWVERRPHPQDRRSFQLYLLPTVFPLIEQISALGIDTREQALEGLDSGHRELLAVMLNQVKNNLQQIENPVTSPIDEHTPV